MVVLNNGKLEVKIAKKGAEIRSVVLNGEQCFWNGDAKYWAGVAPVLFPICGGLKDNKFTIDQAEYMLDKHGFARKMDFSIEKQSGSSVVLLLTETDETLKSYPWSFEFRVKYTLSGSSMKVEYDVKNTSEKNMYMAIGSHEAYACPEGIEDYDIIFEKKETLKSARVEGSLISRTNTNTVLFESDTLPLYNKYFEVDALVFTDIKSRFATLRNRKTGKSVSVDFNGFDYLLIWTKPNAPYLCIEPWTCPPTYVDDDYDITLKEGMSTVSPNEHFKRQHIIYF